MKSRGQTLAHICNPSTWARSRKFEVFRAAARPRFKKPKQCVTCELTIAASAAVFSRCPDCAQGWFAGAASTCLSLPVGQAHAATWSPEEAEGEALWLAPEVT